ncbi:ABC-type multidrug transport system ATPase subunit [Fontibacillus phaseoli]|uniref:ABC-type multidrug transport system ATPase subunit n=1 Tax=Fontibacillus phaseoli TaxID=1416533 RepID=A0A369ATV5_9BACL|nr:ATP-binding cassette domain-containing protein [Fontibacillus phaseoli]RCX12802.1 ABC-type multidrug transport system ATPase subunit [Fontibacillus phaseoli]
MIVLENVHQPLGGFTLQIGRLRIHRGLTLLVGSNGAGKTTLLELLATLQMPRRGSILYHQRSAAEDLPLLRSQIGYVPAEIELYEEMTVYKLLVYLAELKGVYRLERIEGLLRDFRLEASRNVKIKSLSLGVRRRIAIVQSLLAAPYFLFLDEPLNAMDSAERKLAIAYLSRYAVGKTILAAVHELNEWEAAADHILWLDQGRVRFEGERELWTSDLPLKVWEGVISQENFGAVIERNLLLFREVPEGMYVRLVGKDRPFPGLIEAEPGMEDAYFVRQRGRSLENIEFRGK